MSRQTSKNRLVDKYFNGKINKFPEVSFIKKFYRRKNTLGNIGSG